MRSTLPLLGVLGLVGALANLSACQTTECGPGTIDRGGECEPADLAVGTAKCGPNTELRGDQCVPKLPPTQCDPTTTQPDTDPTTGVTTCIGTGGGGCSAPLACPNPATGKQTLCGQIYKFVDDSPFAADAATGSKCASGATTGPCALKISVLDYSSRRDLTSTASNVYVDDCGRYRISDIDPGSSVVELVIFSEASVPPSGAGSVTVPSVVGFFASAATATAGRLKDFEAFVVDAATTKQWAMDGGPALKDGIFAAIFRAHATNGDRIANQAGVKITVGGVPQDGAYFVEGPARQHIASPASAITATTSNGAALVSLPASTSVGGKNGLPSGCIYVDKLAGSSPGTVFFSIFRPTSAPAQTCTL